MLANALKAPPVGLAGEPGVFLNGLVDGAPPNVGGDVPPKPVVPNVLPLPNATVPIALPKAGADPVGDPKEGC